MTSPVTGDEIDPRYPELTVSEVADVEEGQERVAPHAEKIPWSQDRTRETARGRIALALLGILGFIIAGAFVTLWANWGTGDEIDSLLTMIFAPVIGLVGAVTGFYFGEKSASSAAAAAAAAAAPPTQPPGKGNVNR